jgi:hypothetical protein
MSRPADGEGAAADRDRDAAGRARNARPRDRLGRLGGRAGSSEPPIEEPALSPAAAIARAQALLDDERPFEAHEVLEAVWKASTGSDRELWRGLTQIAVGVTHTLRGNHTGARALFTRAEDTLRAYAGTGGGGVDVDGVRVDVAGLRSWAVAASNDPTIARHPPTLQLKAG